MKEYLKKIKYYLSGIIIDLQKSATWKVQVTTAISYNSSKDVDEEHAMQSKRNNEAFMIYDNANDIVDELFKSLFSRYQSGLETLMRGRDFIFDSVQLLHYKCHKINFRRDGSYIDSPDLIKTRENKKFAK